MECMEKLLDALDEVGEAACFYKDEDIVSVNKLFSGIFRMSREELAGRPIMDLCHERSLDMITDFMKRRRVGGHDIPTNYSAFFVTADDTEIELELTILKTRNTEGAILVIAKEK